MYLICYDGYLRWPQLMCPCQSPNWNEPHTASGTPRFGILTTPYPNRFGESPFQYGDWLFCVFSVTHKISLFSPKIKAIPTPWRTSSCQKFRQPKHCARKSRIRQTREGTQKLGSGMAAAAASAVVAAARSAAGVHSATVAARLQQRGCCSGGSSATLAAAWWWRGSSGSVSGGGDSATAGR